MTNVALFLGISNLSNTPLGNALNAASVGAKTVNGPGLESVSTRSAAFTAATSVLNDPAPEATSTIVFETGFFASGIGIPGVLGFRGCSDGIGVIGVDGIGVIDGMGCVDGMGVGIADGTVGAGFTSFAITAAADSAIAAVINAVIDKGEIFFKDVIILLNSLGGLI